MKVGDVIRINSFLGVQDVTIVGWQAGTDNMVIDDGRGGNDSKRFCDPAEIIYIPALDEENHGA